MLDTGGLVVMPPCFIIQWVWVGLITSLSDERIPFRIICESGIVALIERNDQIEI